MESALTVPREARALSTRLSLDPGSVAAWLLPAGLITYLGMRSGGYDAVVSDQVALAVWWVVFLLLALGLAPLRLSWPARAGLALLVAYAAWTAISLSWTESTQRTIGDVSLVLLYVPLALLAFSIRGRDAARLMVNGLAVAIVAITVVALLSRLRFEWFAVPEVVQNLPQSTRKLSYPIGYWNALAALMAMGIPLLLHAATGARRLIWRALAAGAVPALVLCAFLTASRGGAIAVVLGVAVFLLLAPDRLAKVAVSLLCAGGSALLVAAADQRSAVRDGLRTALAAHQGNQLIAIVIVTCGAVALVAYAIALVDCHAQRPRWTTPSRARTTIVASAAAVAAALVFLGAGGAGFLHREWAQFKTQPGPAAGTALQRLQNLGGNGRYQFWQSADRAAQAHPLTGTGAGTFVYWWARDPKNPGGYVQDAHSLYLQTLGELGYPGFVLICALIALILICGVVRCIRVRDPEIRLAVAAATAAAVVFAFSAAIEWIWLIPVLPATLFILAGVIFMPADAAVRTAGASQRARRASRGPLRRALSARAARGGGRVIGGAVALAAMVAVALPLAATAAVRQSQAAARSGDLSTALASAREAVRLEPYTSAPWLQEALVLELGGYLRSALASAEHATANDAYDSSAWLVASRLQARTGHAGASLADYLRARALDPRSSIFTQ